jgi:hypothetical protein
VLVSELLADITGVGPRRLGAGIRRATFRFGGVVMALGVSIVAIVVVVVTIVVVAGREQ